MDEDASKDSTSNTILKNRPNPRPLIDCLDIRSTFEKRKKNRTFQRNQSTRSNEDQIDNSPGKIEVGRSTVDLREPMPEHLNALRNAFNKILTERLLCENSFKLRQNIFNQLRQLILAKRPDCRINLYGSMLFECCLEKPGIMDIDVQFKKTLQYDALKELLEIITNSDLCKEAHINTDHKPSCIDLTVNESNVRVRLTAGYNRGINLSKLIRIYTKFDSRVIKLLCLFRIFTKICNVDKPDLGTLHPLVFHIMIIHFLQQLDPPILPCLHEYVYGIDHVPITMNENQYSEFFRVCNEYSREWKSTNTTQIELLFLQLLSYYCKTFNTKQFVVSIQTRMPVVKIDKNWHSKKLLVEDPSDIKRSLCQTMQAVRSINYFRDTLNAALNYFGRKQKRVKKAQSNGNSSQQTDDDFIEVVTEDENETPTIEPTNALHNSYNLFYKRLPSTLIRDINTRQNRVRDYYKKTFTKSLLEPKIKLNSLIDQQCENLNENEIEEAFQHDLEHDFETMDANDEEQNIILDITIPNSDNYDDETLNTDFDELNIDNNIDQNQLVARQLFPTTNKIEQVDDINQSSSVSKNDEQEHVINDNIMETPQQLISSVNENDEISTADAQSTEPTTPKIQEDIAINSSDDTNNNNSSMYITSIEDEKISCIDDSSSDYYYDFQAENFHAEQGAPFVCTICNNVGHIKSECPELIVPNMVDLPQVKVEWIQALSLLCQYITESYKPRQIDIENREKILKQLEKQFEKDYPDCSLHAFGSFYNGFGFQKSDLDVCIVFKDQREENADEVHQIMKKILKSMRSHADIFEDVQPILHAKVPIIRSRHRRLQIEIDISFHNMLAIENTRLLKTYANIDPRVSQLGYMIKHLAKTCDIGDASRGTLSSYAYIIMLIHFLQQVQPPVLPVLQQLSDNSTAKDSLYRKCSQWNVYFYENLLELKKLWKDENKSPVGELWIEFLRFYTERFNYEEHVVTIRLLKPLLKHEKGWFRQTIAIEDPFELNHNLAGGLSIRNWTLIRRVLIRARQQFGLQSTDINISNLDMHAIESILFNVNDLCPTNAPRRCAECNEPYHIRKRCPKLISLANEKEKSRRLIVPEQQQQQQILMNNQYGQYSTGLNNSRFPLYPEYYYSKNGYRYPFSIASHQRIWTQPYSNESPLIYPNFSFHQNQQQSINNSNRFHHSNNQRRRCFICGSLNHIKANCPQLHSNISQR